MRTLLGRTDVIGETGSLDLPLPRPDVLIVARNVRRRERELLRHPGNIIIEGEALLGLHHPAIMDLTEEGLHIVLPSHRNRLLHPPRRVVMVVVVEVVGEEGEENEGLTTNQDFDLKASRI